MRPLLFAVLLSASLALAQDNTPGAAAGDSKHVKGDVTIQGCVSRSSGDYILFKQDPAVTYELQATHKIRLRKYLGQRVEVTGEVGPTLSSSSDALNKVGSASSATITIRTIRTIDRECSQR